MLEYSLTPWETVRCAAAVALVMGWTLRDGLMLRIYTPWTALINTPTPRQTRTLWSIMQTISHTLPASALSSQDRWYGGLQVRKSYLQLILGSIISDQKGSFLGVQLIPGVTYNGIQTLSVKNLPLIFIIGRCGSICSQLPSKIYCRRGGIRSASSSAMLSSKIWTFSCTTLQQSYSIQ